MLANAQLLAAHPQLPLVALLQSSDRYSAISDPSTPALVARAFSSSVPCAGVSRKFLHAYVIAPIKANTAAPSTSLDLSKFFIVEPLEGGADPDRECPVGRIDSDINVAELIPDVTRRAREGPRRQGGIEPGVPCEGHQVFALDIHAPRGEPTDQTGGNRPPHLEGAQPHIRRAFDEEAADIATAQVILIEARILGVLVAGMRAAC